MCGYWGRAPPSQIWFSKVGPFSETIFQADFRSWLEIWNFQLLGCVNPEKLSFLESWLFVCGYWGSTPPSQVWFSKVGPLLDLARSGQNFEMPRSHLSWLRGCVSPEKQSLSSCGYFGSAIPSPGPIFKSRTCFGLGMKRPKFWDTQEPKVAYII